MNASVRWVTHFLDELECVKCRSSENLILYQFNGKPVDPAKYTIEQLRWMVDRMDAWCSDCPVVVNTRVAGPGRRIRKEEAAQVANVRGNLEHGSHYDEYVIESGRTATRQAVVDAAKQRPCAVCGNRFPIPAMTFYHVTFPKLSHVAMMPNRNFTVHEIITEIEKCAVVCFNCYKLISNKYCEPPKEKVRLDENFWLSHF